MRIYRYVPDGLRFRSMSVWYGDRFWPEGISLGSRAEREFPKGFGGKWWLEGNQYSSEPTDKRALPDFVATTMNILIGSEKAVDQISAELVRVALDGERAWAVQLPVLDGALTGSEAVQGPKGEPLFVNRHFFNEANITADVFWLAEAMPFSYVYMTETFVQRALALNLTGLTFLELVWDNGPVELRYSPLTNVGAMNGYRYFLEMPFISARAAMHGYVDDDINPILEIAMRQGRLPTAYPT